MAAARASLLLLAAEKKPSADRNDGWTALVLPPAFPPCAQLLPAAIPGNLTLAQQYLDDRPKSIHLSSNP
jgi:hypothetical protein